MKYEIINEKKKELGITNAQLAEITGITLSTLDKITSGANQNPKLSTMQAIARAIGCTLDDFDDEAVVTISSAAISIARRYDALDDHSKKVVEAVVEIESKRPASHLEAARKAMGKELRSQEEAEAVLTHSQSAEG